MTGAIAVDVVRDLSRAPEFRSTKDDEDNIGLLSGHFSAFNNWYRVSSMFEGNFIERIAPGAFGKTITEDRSGMRVLYDHGFDPSVGNKVLGPIRELREEDEGGYYEVPLFDTSYNRDLLPGLRAGQYGASFRMKVEDDEWDDEPRSAEHNPEAVPERTITRAKVMEFGPVTFPANPQASASVRSATDQFYSRLRQRDVGAFEEACRAANIQIPNFPVGSLSPGAAGGRKQDEGRGFGGSSQPSKEAQSRHRQLILLGIGGIR
jgi:HK97 family phage prohead protease